MKKFQTLLAAGAIAAGVNSGATVQADTLAGVAMSNSQFSTLVAAVKAAGLPPALSGKKHLTVFAPTNAAFAKLPAGTVQMLLKPENKATLVKILTYHIIPGRVRASQVVSMRSGSQVKTLQGEKLAVRLKNGVMLDPFVSGKAKVIKTDIKADNGIIHAIDTVLIPPSVAKAMARKNKM